MVVPGLSTGDSHPTSAPQIQQIAVSRHFCGHCAQKMLQLYLTPVLHCVYYAPQGVYYAPQGPKKRHFPQVGLTLPSEDLTNYIQAKLVFITLDVRSRSDYGFSYEYCSDQ